MGEKPVAPKWTSATLTQIRSAQLRRTFAPSTVFAIAVFIGLFFGFVRYVELDDEVQEQVEQYYQWFIHVNIMIFVGFGFLMTFMRRYSLSAVSLNFFMSAIMFLEAILCIGACQQVFWNAKADKIRVGIPLLIDSAFCAGSGMIAFGAVIGKSTPTQLFWILFAQVPLYALNQRLVIYTFKALDMGGTLVIHLFGAYYGLSASLMLSRRQAMHGLDHPKNGSSYLNDVFSMIGTLFLWLYWPSFNGALASIEGGHALSDTHHAWQFLSVVNTLISLLGSAIATFLVSSMVGGTFNMVHVQNSSLAGGVAMGAACTLKMTPGGALVVGTAAGTLSVLGFEYLTPFLDRTIGLGDTCGIHNLHGMPAILGGLVAGLASLGQTSGYLMHDTGRLQLGYQVLAMVVTVGIAVSWGTLMGWLASVLNPTNVPEMMPAELFDDGPWWAHQFVEPLPMDADVSKHSAVSVHLAHGEPVMPVTGGATPAKGDKGGNGGKATFEDVFNQGMGHRHDHSVASGGTAYERSAHYYAAGASAGGSAHGPSVHGGVERGNATPIRE